MGARSHQSAELKHGAHRSPEYGVCVMERASMLAAERSLESGQLPLPLLSARMIVAARPELIQVAERLREDAPGVRGVALVERLLSEGRSPLRGGSAGELRRELRRIQFMLGA